MLSADYSTLLTTGLRTLSRRVRRQSVLRSPLTPAPGTSYIFLGPETPPAAIGEFPTAPHRPASTSVPAGIRSALRRMSVTAQPSRPERPAPGARRATMPAAPLPAPAARERKPSSTSTASSERSCAVSLAPPLAPRRKPVALTIRTSASSTRPLPHAPRHSTHGMRTHTPHRRSQPPRAPLPPPPVAPAPRTPADFLSFSATSVEFPVPARGLFGFAHPYAAVAREEVPLSAALPTEAEAREADWRRWHESPAWFMHA